MMAEGDRRVVFSAEIRLSPQDLREADGDPRQAVQNIVGHTGADVIEVEVRGD